MKRKKIHHNGVLLLFVFLSAASLHAQTAWFVDGYHGGVYGHYPLWQARFMVEELTKQPDWKICLEIEPETWDTVNVKDADNFKTFREYYETTGRYGRIEFVNPTWAQPYCYNISGESIIRQFYYGMKKIRQYFPNASFDTYSVEEPCFTSSLPQILKGFGYKYGVLRNPNTCWGGYTTAFGKDLVNWIGPDGSSLPAVPRYACEDFSTVNTFSTRSNDNSREFIAACFADGIKFPVGMTFQDAGWNHGPWLEKFIKDFYHPSVYATWTAYIDMIKDKVTPVDWHFSVEDVKPGLVWGAQVLQKIAQQVRVSENKLIMAEKMAAFNCLLNKTPWPTDDFAEAWRTLMLAQHHDCWIVPYNGRPGNTWADKVSRWTDASNRIADTQIAALFDTDEKSSAIRVFNTMGFERTDFVTMTLPETADGVEMVVRDRHGKTLPSQMLTNEQGQSALQFEATVPGMGYAAFELKQQAKHSSRSSVNSVSSGTLTIETDFYSATFDADKGGAITGLLDKKHHRRQLVANGKTLNNLRGYFYQEGQFRGSADQNATVTIEDDGALFIRVKVENRIAENTSLQRITFYKKHPRIDFELRIDWNSQPGIGAYDQSDNYKAEERKKAFYNDEYKLQLLFPFDGLGDRLYKNAPFDVCASQSENTIYHSWDSIKHNVVLNWVDVTNASGDYGVALFTDHTTSYLQTDALPLGLTVQYVGKALWGRNYRVDGPTCIHYALLPHADNWNQADIELSSAAWNEPLIAGRVNSPNDLGRYSFFSLSDKKMLVSSVTMDGDDLLVRFYNTSSEPQKENVTWYFNIRKIDFADLNGNACAEVGMEKKPDGTTVTALQLPPFGFQTVRVRF
ncbi:MAG: hypothetical protein LBR67_09555 [Dysgonamonadaceae bacterium]|jgi:alpha-mannosidase|nr:hypothetical protein [Dysgonamonadaceae bacterium]